MRSVLRTPHATRETLASFFADDPAEYDNT